MSNTKINDSHAAFIKMMLMVAEFFSNHSNYLPGLNQP